jgi:hypothetical protein
MTSNRTSSAADRQEALTAVLQELRDQVEVLRMAIDELREEIQCAVRNLFHREREARQITSMPCDPCAADFASRVNQVDSTQREALRHETATAKQSEGPPGGPPAPSSVPSSSQTLGEQPTSEPTASHSQLPSQPDTTASHLESTNSKGKRQSLYMRIYQQPLLTEIVRSIGYEQLTRQEVLKRLEPLDEKYGRERTIEAAQELLSALPGRHDIWALTHDVRRWSRALLGPSPVEPACGTPAPGHDPVHRSSPTPEKPPVGTEPSSKDKEVKASRKVVLAKLREHLETTGEASADVPAEIQRVLGERGRMVPDLILGEAAPYELLAVRRTLSAMQRHDMHEWLEVSDFGEQATRVWPHQDAQGWEWVFDVIARKEDDAESDADECETAEESANEAQ